MSPVERSLYLLQSARFFTLASRSLDGRVWASTVNYVPAFTPLRVIWCSMRLSRHSENIRQYSQVSGSVFRTDLQDAPRQDWTALNLLGFLVKFLLMKALSSMIISRTITFLMKLFGLSGCHR